MEPDRVLARLRDPADPAVAGLIRLAVDATVDRSLRELVDARRLAGRLAEAIRAVAASPDARARLVARLEAERARWRAEGRTLRELSLPELDDAVRAVAGVPWSPSEALVLRVIDHEAVRALLGEVLQGALSRFGQRLRSLDQGVLGGLGGAVARKGTGLLGGLAKGISGAADQLVGGLKDEVEAALQGRIRDQLSGATDEALKAIAAWVASPDHEAALASLRRSLVDVVLDRPIGELVGEVDEVDVRPVVDALHAALGRAAARPGLQDELAARLAEALDRYGDLSAGALLDDLGARASLGDAAADVLADPVRDVVATDAFAAWWSDLCS
jgi:hypothetical protein